jgi:hypothetical protein
LIRHGSSDERRRLKSRKATGGASPMASEVYIKSASLRKDRAVKIRGCAKKDYMSQIIERNT